MVSHGDEVTRDWLSIIQSMSLFFSFFLYLYPFSSLFLFLLHFPFAFYQHFFMFSVLYLSLIIPHYFHTFKEVALTYIPGHWQPASTSSFLYLFLLLRATKCRNPRKSVESQTQGPGIGPPSPNSLISCM